jgi:hypothetical protein
MWTCNFIVLKLCVHITCSLAHSLTHSVEQRPSWVANWFSASQEIPCILWNLNVRYHIHKCLSTCLYPELKVSVQVRYLLCECFVTRCVLWRGVVSTSPNPQGGGLALFGCPQLYIQYIRSYHPYWRLFLHPQPEDARCRGNRDPLITDDPIIVGNTVQLKYYLNLFQFFLYLTGFSLSNKHIYLYVCNSLCKAEILSTNDVK